MNWVDVLVLVLALLAGVSGARQGMVTAAASFIGVLAGAVIGVRIAPSLIESYQSPEARVALGVSIVIVLIAIGETLGVLLGRAVQRRIDAEALRQVDSFLGAVVQGIAALVVAWLVALPLSKSSVYSGLTGAVRDSSVLRIVDTVMPNVLRQLPTELTSLLDVSGFPDVLAPFSPTPITDVGPADPVLLNSPIVRQAKASVLKVRGRARSCSRALEGSGFVVAPQRVITNAHVVAGTDQVQVEISPNNALDATVVSYDPEVDVAILKVPGLRAPVLPLAPKPAISGLSGLVLGYPLDGPYTASAARVRDRIHLRGPDIYNASTVVRNVYTVRAVVRSGNSGGPLLDSAGEVLGLVFGAAVDNDETGFVLADDEISSQVAAAPNRNTEVSTGSCAS
ncbi:MAG: acid resistance periplasmic serine protease MarP [Pseudonocardiales bacterium]|nr:MarP family serine protease [Actinomycetota bacterium]PZS24561.1 MAG: acid resistance periplasmic serine protease MarP [Pseudonocardiales bacterium]